MSGAGNRLLRAQLRAIFEASANSGSVRGSLLDPSGAAIKGATVGIPNPVSRYNQSVQTDAQGKFEFDNVPYNPYHVSVVMTGFETAGQDADVRSPLPIDVTFRLKIGASTTTVNVTEAGDLLETDPEPVIRMWTARTVRRAASGEVSLPRSAHLSRFASRLGFGGFERPVPQGWATTLPIHSPSMARRSHGSAKQGVFRIRFRSNPCSRWKSIEGAPPRSTEARPAW